jgi:hypothetical protein
LTEFRIEKSDLAFKGSALGFNQISDFMKGLNENAMLSEVELKNSQQFKDPSLGVETATFELKAKRR